MNHRRKICQNDRNEIQKRSRRLEKVDPICLDKTVVRGKDEHWSPKAKSEYGVRGIAACENDCRIWVRAAQNECALVVKDVNGIFGALAEV